MEMIKKRTKEERALMEIRYLLKKGTNKYGTPLENLHKTLDYIEKRLKEIK